MGGVPGRIADAFLFSSLWLAAAAALLAAAASRALGGPAGLAAPALAFGGTLAVYNLDRLRDVTRDRASAPARTAFVDRQRAVLASLGAAGTLLGAGCAAALPPRALAPLALALPLALAHRRLKRFWPAKAPYVSAGWLLVTVGVPAAAARAAGAGVPTLSRVGWTGVVLGLAFLGNAIASNVRERRGGRRRRWGRASPRRRALRRRQRGRPRALRTPARPAPRPGRARDPRRARRFPPERTLRPRRPRRRARAGCARSPRARLRRRRDEKHGRRPPPDRMGGAPDGVLRA